MKSIKQVVLLAIMILISQVSEAQQKDKDIADNHKADIAMRQGNKQYNNASFSDAEYQYRTSTSLSETNLDNSYNFGNALLQQKRYKEAIKRFQSVVNVSKDKTLQAKTYYNMGNAYMGLKDYQNAVTHYKESLKRNPNDEQARYNYAMAKQFLKNNPPQDNQDDKDQDKQNDKDKQDKDKQDDNKKDQKDKDQQNKDDNKQDNQDDKNQDKDGQNQDQKDKGKQNQDKQENQSNEDQKDQDGQKDDKDPSDGQEPKDDNQQSQLGKTGKGKMSHQQIRQLLEALNNEEKKTQDKVNAKKVKAVPIKRDKDW